jgi:hypothetical protein
MNFYQQRGRPFLRFVPSFSINLYASMNRYFSFNPQRFDFWPVYETIKQYYPLGLRAQQDLDVLLEGYPGQEQRWQLAADNIINTKNYRSRWSAFQKELQSALKKRIHSDTDIANPCFSAYLPLRKEQHNNLTYIKELRFCISFLGPYFTIFGLDQSQLELPMSHPLHLPGEESSRPGFHSAIHAVTVSPYQEYAPLFTALEQQIRLRFPDYRLLPFRMSMQLLEGLPHDNPSVRRDRAVFEALFTSHHNLADLPATAFRGDTSYGLDAWQLRPQA